MKRPARTPTEYWVAYSDVLGNLLLVFVLVLVTAMANLGEQVSALDASRSALTSREQDLRERTARLSVANRDVADRDLALTTLHASLAMRERELAEARRSLEAALSSRAGFESKAAGLQLDRDAVRQQLSLRESELGVARSELTTALAGLDALRHGLAQRETELGAARSDLTTTLHALGSSRAETAAERASAGELQKRLRDMVGVRRSIVESLRASLGGAKGLLIDGATGAVRLGDGVLFDEAKDAIRPEAAPVLKSFLEQYLSSLLGNPENRAHLARIEIEGHTNDNGTFESNLELSYRRARAVLAFLLAQQFPYQDDLRALVRISGCSFSDPVRSADGKLDKVRSRRIEIKFRLRDDGGK